jgi:hypothetical protein
VNEYGLKCRRCDRVTPDVVVIYSRNRSGALIPGTAQCKGNCPAPPSADGPRRPAPVTAIRPGKCAACTWDIVPGDKIARSGDGLFWHWECAPAEEQLPAVATRERTRTRRAAA